MVGMFFSHSQVGPKTRTSERHCRTTASRISSLAAPNTMPRFRRDGRRGLGPARIRPARRVFQAVTALAERSRSSLRAADRKTHAHWVCRYDVRSVQVWLGHRSIETTFRYQACLPPPVTSSADPVGPAQEIAEMTNLPERCQADYPHASSRLAPFDLVSSCLGATIAG
jgi:hypothetical protein